MKKKIFNSFSTSISLMKKAMLHFVWVCAACFIWPVQSHAQWVQTNGPYGGQVVSFAVSGTNLFAGTRWAGVFLSTNNGTSWTSVSDGLPDSDVSALAVAGTNLFAGTNDGIFLSTDNGTSWTAVNNGLTNGHVRALALSGSGLFAGTGGGVFLSANNGASWTEVNNGLTNTNVLSLAISGTNLFAGTTDSGVFLSTNNGASWTAVNTGLTNSCVQALFVSGANLFAGTWGGAFLSPNNGASWTAVNNGLTSVGVYAFTVSGTNLFAGTSNGAFLSTDNGSNWTAINSGLMNTDVRALIVSDSNLFAGTYGNGVFLSINNGESWTEVNTNMTATYVRTIAVNPDGAGNLFAGTFGGGVFISTDNGASWIAHNTGMTFKDVNTFAFSGSNIFAGGAYGVCLSTNNGESWTGVNNGLPGNYIGGLTFSGSNLFAGTGGAGIYRTTNNGESWTAVNNGMTAIFCGRCAVSGLNLFAGTYQGGVFLSTNDGESWTAVNNGLTNLNTGPLVVKGANLFTGSWEGDGLFRSTNNGTNWTAINEGLTDTHISQLEVSGTNLLVLTNNGIFISTNDGANWTATGLPNPSITSLAVSGTNLFAGTQGEGVLVTEIPQTPPPAITDFNPQSGPVGTTVTITGSNFNTTATNNVVFFGAVKAVVNSATSTSLSVTVPTGATYAPITVTDTTIGLTAYSSEPFRITFDVGSSLTTSSFSTKVDLTTGSHPYNVGVGDLDGDGKSDLAVANSNSGTISVFRNTSVLGSLTSGSFAEKVDFAAGVEPNCVAIEDLDGDGKLDIAVVNYSSNMVSVFRNTSVSGSITSGSFAAKVDFATGNHPYMLAIGDLDGDGKPDLAATNQTDHTVSVLQNTGVSGSITSGSFAAKMDFTAGGPPIGVAIGDLDGDRKPDMAVANSSANTVSVFRNTSVSGSITSGSFAAKVDFTANSATHGIAIGDLDGDGKPDLAVTNPSSAKVSVFRNTSVSGSINSGSFAAKVDFSSGTFPRGVSISDLDGDGKPDLATANSGSSTVSVLRNTCESGSIVNGSFATKVDFATGNEPSCVGIGDLDGDGKPDLSGANYTSNTVSVLRNLMGKVTVTSPNGGENWQVGSAHDITWTSINTSGAVCIEYSTSNGSSWTDVITSTPDDGTYSWTIPDVPSTNCLVRITDTDGSPTDQSDTVFTILSPSPQILSFTPVLGPTGQSVTITGTNFNTTATNNVVFFGAVKAVVNSATSTSLGVTTPTGATYAPITVTDTTIGLTAYSSKPFTVTFPGNYLIDANSFASKVDFATDSGPQHIAISDLDGDGKPDLVTTNGPGHTVSVFQNTSTSGGITSGSFAAKEDFAANYGPGDITISDLDGDGKPDLAVTNWLNTVSVFRNTSTSGNISFADKVDFATGDGTLLVAIGDLDGDGKPDLAVSNYSSNTASVFRNMSSNGSISFADSVNFVEEGNPIGVAISDLDGDGKPELIMTSSGNNILSIFRNTSVTGSITHSSFAARMDFEAGSGPADIVIGDLDVDGKPDLAVSTKGDNAISVFRNTCISGSITFDDRVDFVTGSNPYVNDIGDLDGDGRPDLVVANHNDNTISVLRNTSTSGSITSSSCATKVDFITGSACHGVAICDLDGDGKPDLAVSNFGDNTVSVLRNVMGKVTVTSPNSGENWQVGSTHDITWTSINTSGTVHIEYSTNNGSSWTDVIASTPDDGTYSWTISDMPSTNCLVRVSDTDGSPSDQSDDRFTISPTYTDVETASIGSPISFNEGGDDPGDGHVIDMTFTSLSGSGTVTVVQTNIPPPNSPCLSACGFYWVLTTDAGISDFSTDITFHYTDSDVSGFTESFAFLGIAKFNESTNTWQWLGGTVDAVNNSITVNGVTSFSTFALFPRIFGDVTGDGYVDAADLQHLGDCWHSTNSSEFTEGSDARFFNYNKNTDSGNQIIDAADLQVFGDCWHNGVVF